MADFDNTNSGAMFRNDKQGVDKRPDWRGSINIDGKEYWISCWDKDTHKGPVRSLKVEAKQGKGEAPAKKPVASSGRSNPGGGFGDDFEDSIPF